MLIVTNNTHMKHELEIAKQTWIMPCKPVTYRVQIPQNPIWPPGGHFLSNNAENQQAPYYTHMWCATEVWTWYSKSNLKLGSGNRKIQYGPYAAISKAESLEINRLLSVATNNMHMEFEIEFQSKLELSSGKHAAFRRTDRHTYGRTGGRTDS